MGHSWQFGLKCSFCTASRPGTLEPTFNYVPSSTKVELQRDHFLNLLPFLFLSIPVPMSSETASKKHLRDSLHL